MLDSKQLAPNLLLVVNDIENLRVDIATQWVKISSVKTIFIAYKISPKKFKDKFGIPIIEYFITVVREEKSAGDCPIMSKLVKFLLKKNITPKDVFDICMGLRRTLVFYLFKKGLLKDNSMKIMDEVASIFDTNLSGVLAIFTTFYQEQQKNIQESVIQKKKYNQILKIINFINTKIFMVQNGRIIMGNKSFFETLGVKNVKQLYKKYEDGFSFMKDISDFKNDFDLKEIESWLCKMHKKDKPFKTTIHHKKHSKVFTYSGRITTLPDTNPVSYIITLNNIDTHLEDQEVLKEKFSHDKLTGLNNYIQFEHLLGESQRKAIENVIALCLIIIDIPELREINEEQGYYVGDRVIKEVANDIRAFTDDTMILAHLEGSRFGILMSYKNEQECYDWCCKLYMKLIEKPEKKTLSITAFDLGEKINKLLMRAYDLADIEYTSLNVIRTDFDNIEKFEILPEQKLFTEIFKELHVVSVSLYYKELPLITTSKIIYVDNNSVVLSFSDKQLSIVQEKESIYFELQSIGYVKAQIYLIDTYKMHVTIKKFTIDNHSPLQREKFRIQADDNMKITLISAGVQDKGIVLNMNEESIAVKLKRIKNLKEGQLVSLSMVLNIQDKMEVCNTNASIYRIEKIKGAYKVILESHVDSANKSFLMNYIASRQMEIIKEINAKVTVDYSI